MKTIKSLCHNLRLTNVSAGIRTLAILMLATMASNCKNEVVVEVTDKMLIPESEMLALREQGVISGTYCKGTVVAARKVPNTDGCTSQDCEDEYLGKVFTYLCKNERCDLKENTWYPANCPGWYFPRCMVMVDNIVKECR